MIDTANGEECVSNCGQGQNLAPVPSRGQWELDVRQSQIATKRQLGALDAVRFVRIARPDLRDIITGKRAPEAPSPPSDVTFFQSDLDDDKLEAVRSALGTKDLLLVEGPPGTGKPKFITELVAPVPSRIPEARIMMS